MKMIETERLLLEGLSENDRESVIDILTNEQVKQTYMIPDFESREQAGELFEGLMKLSEREDRFVRGIFLKKESSVKGCLIGLVNDVGISDGIIELGYAILPMYHNRGYATEMLRAVITELFKIGFRQIEAGAFEENEASFSVMRKSGMKPVENTDEIEYRGTVHKCRYYAISAQDCVPC